MTPEVEDKPMPRAAFVALCVLIAFAVFAAVLFCLSDCRGWRFGG